MEEGAKFCGKCGEPITTEQEVMPITETPQLSKNTITTPVTSIVEEDQSVAVLSKTGRKKKHKKVILVLSVLLLAVAAIFACVFVIVNAEKSKPLNRIFLSMRNVIKEENFAVRFVLTDHDNNYEENISVAYEPDRYIAFGSAGQLDWYSTDDYTLLSGGDDASFYRIGYLDTGGPHRSFLLRYHVLNAIGKCLLGKNSYLDDINSSLEIAKEYPPFDEDFHLSEETIKRTMENFRVLFSDDILLKEECGYQIQKIGKSTCLNFSIDQYSEFWESFWDCLEPLALADNNLGGFNDIKNDFRNNISFDAKLEIRDDRLCHCYFTINNHHDKNVIDMALRFSNIGATKIEGLDSPEEMDAYAEDYINGNN